jgi:hypothetical protein
MNQYFRLTDWWTRRWGVFDIDREEYDAYITANYKRKLPQRMCLIKFERNRLYFAVLDNGNEYCPLLRFDVIKGIMELLGAKK